jgi:hypothetical protein
MLGRLRIPSEIETVRYLCSSNRRRVPSAPLTAMAFSLCSVLSVAIVSLGHAQAHGSVSMEHDACKLKLGPYAMHFSGYQPDLSRQQFCEDIPSIGRTIVVLDFLDEALRDLPITVRISRSEDNGAQRGAPIYQVAQQTYPGGSIALEYSFDAPGKFVGEVDAADKGLVATFPFTVGRSTNWSSMLAWGGGLLILTNFALAFVFIRPKTIRVDAVHERFGEAM